MALARSHCTGAHESSFIKRAELLKRSGATNAIPAGVLRQSVHRKRAKAAANFQHVAAVPNTRRRERGGVEGGVRVLHDGVAAAVQRWRQVQVTIERALVQRDSYTAVRTASAVAATRSSGACVVLRVEHKDALQKRQEPD